MKIKNKKKFIKYVVIIILILLIGIVVIKNITKKYNTIEDFNTVREVLEYLGCRYIRQENIKDDEYQQNIYVRFNKDLYENNSSNERFFNNLVQMVAKVSNYKSIILTDTNKNIVIKIKCNSETNEFNRYYINDIENYFAKQDSNNSITSLKQEENAQIVVNSSVLNEAINKKWIYNDISFGSKESDFENYNIYFDEGIKVRTVTNKVYNIVFNSNYKDPIINSIRVGESFEDIKRKLGNPIYEESSSGVIGYKDDRIYIFFTEDEISVYRVDETDTNKFYKILEEFIEDKIDFNTFIDETTTLWVDYDSYVNMSDYFKLSYTLKGIEIQVTSENKDGIHIYSNYKGIKENQNVEKFINSGKVHIDTKTNLVFKKEVDRISAKENLEYSYINYMNISEEGKTQSNSFYYRIYKYDDGSIYKIGFLSKNENNISNELKENINSYVWYNDTIFLYGKYQDGIYAYDVINRKSQKIISGTDNFEIKGIENNRLKYDDKSVMLRDNSK